MEINDFESDPQHTTGARHQQRSSSIGTFPQEMRVKAPVEVFWSSLEIGIDWN